MSDDAGSTRVAIKHILSALVQKTSHPFILVGGSSLLLHGSQRITNDVDFLVPRDVSSEFPDILKPILEEVQQISHIKDADILTMIVRRGEFDEIDRFAVDINDDGVRVADLDVMLASKVCSYYLRPDGPQGQRKRVSDISDLNWIAHALRARGRVVRTDVSDLLVCGPYNMVLAVGSLYDTFGKESVKVFESVGRELECDWGQEEFVEQIDLYEMEVEVYSDEELQILGSRKKP